MTAAWDLPSPFIHRVSAQASDVDAYGHVNNSVYLRWLDETAWAHSSALGVTPAHCVTTRRGMVVWRSQLHYLAPTFARDALEIGCAAAALAEEHHQSFAPGVELRDQA